MAPVEVISGDMRLRECRVEGTRLKGK